MMMALGWWVVAAQFAGDDSVYARPWAAGKLPVPHQNGCRGWNAGGFSVPERVAGATKCRPCCNRII